MEKSSHITVAMALLAITVWGCTTTSTQQPAPVRVEAGPPLAWGAGTAGRINRSNSGYYQVKAADTLWAIAMVHDLDVEDLAKWNNIRDPDVLVVGQQLRMGPADGRAPPPVVPVATAFRPSEEVIPGMGAPAVQKGFSSLREEGDPARGRERESTKDTYGPILAPVGVETSSLEGDTPIPPPEAAPQHRPEPSLVEPTARPLSRPVSDQAQTSDTEIAKTGDYSGILKASSPRGWNWPVRGKVLQKFGQFGQHRFNGIDIAVTEGQPVGVAASGIVAYADDGLSSYGNLILVRHGGSYMSAYGHNSAILVKPGQKVTAGQIIAKAGSTGGTSTPKLHFELRKGIEPVDPMQYLPKMK